MELNIDTGVEEFRVNGRGVLRFNPADPNLYHRFFAAGAELDGYDAALTKALAALDGDEQQRAAAGLALLNEYDGKIKKLLTGIFGAENDFDAILGGVNLAGVGANVLCPDGGAGAPLCGPHLRKGKCAGKVPLPGHPQRRHRRERGHDGP